MAYIVLSFVLDPMPDNLAAGKPQPTSGELLDTVDRELAAGEKRCEKWNATSRQIRSHCVVVSVNCK